MTASFSSSALADRMVAALDPRPDAHVLDVACGTGDLLARLLSAYPDAQARGLDANLYAIASAESAAYREGVYERVSFGQSDLSRGLPLPNECVDIVLAHDVVERVPGLFKLLDGIYRVLRPGGRALVAETDYASLHWSTVPDELTQAVVEAFFAARRVRATNIVAHLPGALRYEMERGPFTEWTEERLVEESHGYAPGSTGRGIAEAISFTLERNPRAQEVFVPWRAALDARGREPDCRFEIATAVFVAERE